MVADLDDPSKEKKVYYLGSNEECKQLVAQMVGSFRKAVREQRPMLQSIADRGAKTDAASGYSKGFVGEYKSIISELEEITARPPDWAVSKRGHRKWTEVRALSLKHVNERLRGFAAEQLQRSDRVANHVQYGYANGRIFEKRQGVLGRGWQWIAGKFAIGRKYYRTRSATSLFAALGRKYSIEDINHYAAEQLRAEKKPVPKAISPQTLGAISADGKMKLLEELESIHRTRQNTVADYQNLGEKVAELQNMPGVKTEVSDGQARVLLPALLAGATGDVKQAAEDFKAMSPQRRTEVTETLKKLGKLYTNLLKAASEGNAEEVQDILAEVGDLSTHSYRDSIKAADAEGDLGLDKMMRPIITLVTPLFAAPISLINAASRGIAHKQDVLMSEVLKWQAPKDPQEAHELEEANRSLEEIDARVKAAETPDEKQRIKEETAAVRKQASKKVSLANSVKTFKFHLTRLLFGMLDSTPKSETAEQAWSRTLVENIKLDDKNVLSLTMPAKKYQLGGSRWHRQADAAKWSFINAMRKKYDMATPEQRERLPQNGYQRHLDARLNRLALRPSISRQEALNILNYADEASRLHDLVVSSDRVGMNHDSVTAALKPYKMGGAAWTKLMAGRNIKDEPNLNAIFLRRLRQSMGSDGDLVKAFIDLEVKQRDGRDTSGEQQIINGKLGKVLGKLTTLQSYKPRDWEALVSLDQESKGMVGQYITAIKNGSNEDIFAASKALVSMTYRYLLLDPTVSALADKDKLERGAPEDFRLGGPDIKRALEVALATPLLELVGPADAKDFAEKFKEAATGLGWTNGIASIYTLKVQDDHQETMRELMPADRVTEQPASPGGKSPPGFSPLASIAEVGKDLDGSISPASTPPRASSSHSSERTSMLWRFLSREDEAARPASGFGAAPGPRPGSRDGASNRASRVERSSLFLSEGYITPTITPATTPTAPPSGNKKMMEELDYIALGSAFRSYLSQIPLVVSQTLATLGAAKQADEALLVYREANSYASEIAQTTLYLDDGFDYRSNMPADELLDRTIVNSHGLGMNNQGDEIAAQEKALPPVEQRAQILRDYKVFDQEQARYLLPLQRRHIEVSGEAMRRAEERAEAALRSN